MLLEGSITGNSVFAALAETMTLSFLAGQSQEITWSKNDGWSSKCLQGRQPSKPSGVSGWSVVQDWVCRLKKGISWRVHRRRSQNELFGICRHSKINTVKIDGAAKKKTVTVYGVRIKVIFKKAFGWSFGIPRERKIKTCLNSASDVCACTVKSQYLLYCLYSSARYI